MLMLHLFKLHSCTYGHIVEHLEQLRAMFGTLQAARLKFKSSKCEFFKTRMAFLDHVVSKEGIDTPKEN